MWVQNIYRYTNFYAYSRCFRRPCSSICCNLLTCNCREFPVVSDVWLAGSRSCDPSIESSPTQEGAICKGSISPEWKMLLCTWCLLRSPLKLGRKSVFSKSRVGEDDKTIHSLLDEYLSTALQFVLLRTQSFVRCLVQTAHGAKTINIGAERLRVSTERLELDPNSLPLFARDFLIYRCGHR